MKRMLVLLALFSVATGISLFYNASVQAEEAPMTEAHITRIRENCIVAQTNLSQLHASDALLRVNRGQLYELIATKLMAPFNSRVALNKLNGATLVVTATNYETQLNDFRTKYREYEEAMSRTLHINCTNQPVAFYDSVAETREKRKKVHESTVVLHATINTYKANFETFKAQFEENAQ